MVCWPLVELLVELILDVLVGALVLLGLINLGHREGLLVLTNELVDLGPHGVSLIFFVWLCLLLGDQVLEIQIFIP